MMKRCIILIFCLLALLGWVIVWETENERDDNTQKILGNSPRYFKVNPCKSLTFDTCQLKLFAYLKEDDHAQVSVRHGKEARWHIEWETGRREFEINESTLKPDHNSPVFPGFLKGCRYDIAVAVPESKDKNNLDTGIIWEGVIEVKETSMDNVINLITGVDWKVFVLMILILCTFIWTIRAAARPSSSLRNTQ